MDPSRGACLETDKTRKKAPQVKLYDIDNDSVITLQELKNDYTEQMKIEPYNHAETFTAEMFVLLMDTINGRNNCKTMFFTPREVSNIIDRLRGLVLPDIDQCGGNNNV